MIRNPTVLVWVFLVLTFYSPSCWNPNKMDLGSFANFEGSLDIEKKDFPLLKNIYNKTNIDSLELPNLNKELRYSLRLQRKMLEITRRGRKNFSIDGLSFDKSDLKKTVTTLEKWGSTAFIPMSEYFDVYKIAGKDKRGSVLFTGYYSPVLNVRSEMDSEFKYPIYAKPKGMVSLPTRKEIYDEGALIGKDLELAYSNNLLDIQRMQLQGSGYVQYEDGSRYLFSYGGSNGHPRKSIQRYFQKNYAEEGQGVTLKTIEKFIAANPDKADEIIYQNPSYVFFIKNVQGKEVNGSGNVNLKPYISIATDKKYIPTGSCLIASRPIPRKGGIEYKTSLLLAQDVGGGIKGPGHIDLYTGVGAKGKKGTYLKDYGELWLLLAKDNVTN